jgi:hypothetical protein
VRERKLSVTGDQIAVGGQSSVNVFARRYLCRPKYIPPSLAGFITIRIIIFSIFQDNPFICNITAYN